jgi:hypothetical protein
MLRFCRPAMARRPPLQPRDQVVVENVDIQAE